MLPTTVLKKKFIRELSLKIAPLVYAMNPTNLVTAINTTNQIAISFEITIRTTKVGNIEENEIAELREQIVNLALVK